LNGVLDFKERRANSLHQAFEKTGKIVPDSYERVPGNKK
jgi:hypothetical protein